MGRNADVDVLLTHAPADEKAFVAAGYGVERLPVAHNEFLIVGPASDPAKVGGASSAADAFKRIRDAQQTFVSRGDDSGTEKKEKAIWKAASIDPDTAHYVKAGTGMADALRITDQKKGYTLTDLATYLTLQHTLSLKDLYHGDPMMRNDYAVTVVTKAKNRRGGESFATWMTGSRAQQMIASFGRAQFGRALFTADAISTQ
jgi:tungstate transport system substrate-binding protein